MPYGYQTYEKKILPLKPAPPLGCSDLTKNILKKIEKSC